MNRGVARRRNLYKGVRTLWERMDTASVTIGREEYELLQRKAKIADDALVQLKLSLEDLKHGRVSKF